MPGVRSGRCRTYQHLGRLQLRGFIAATSELAGGVPVAANDAAKPLNIPAQPPEQQINWLNLFYSVEWVVFAGFALYIWWRMVADDYRRDLEDDEFDSPDDGFDDGFDEPFDDDRDHPNEPTSPEPQQLGQNKGAAMIEPKPAIQPEQSDPSRRSAGLAERKPKSVRR